MLAIALAVSGVALLSHAARTYHPLSGPSVESVVGGIVAPMDLSPAHLGALLLRNRRTVRAPVALYRAGLGWLFGSRMMMLEHVGRRSGESRYAVLEVVDRPAPDRIVVASGFGRASQWYRNLEAEPRCHVSTGRIRRRLTEAVLLSRDQSAAVLERYREEHPGSWNFLRRVIEEDGAQDPDAIPLVEFRLGG